MKLANLIGTLKGEWENGAFYQSSKELLEKENFTQVLTQYAKESSVLLDLDAKGVALMSCCGFGEFLSLLQEPSRLIANVPIHVDFESVYNLLIALIKDAAPTVIPDLVTYIVNPIVASGTDKIWLKLRVYACYAVGLVEVALTCVQP